LHLGIVEWVLGPGDEATRFRRCRDLGLAGVEVVLGPQDFERIEDRVRRLVAAREATGVAVPSVMLAHHNQGGIASPDPTVARRASEEVRLAIEVGRLLGARVVLIPFFFAAELLGEEDVARAAEALRSLCPQAEAAGVTLCYEGTLPAEGVHELASRIGSRAFACYFDVANAVWLGMDTAAELLALGPLVRQIHLKDTRTEPGDCRLGRGRVDFASTVDAVRRIGFDGWLVLETPGGPPELVARDATFARTLFPELGPLPEPRLGIFSYGFGRGEEVRLAETCRRLGLQAVQLAGDLLTEAVADPARAEAIRQTLAAADVRVAALAGYRNLVAPHEGRRRDHVAFLRRCLEVAPVLGTSVVATETGTRDEDSDWRWHRDNADPRTWALLLEVVAELLEVAQRAGSVLALEGYVQNVVRTHGQLLALLERFRSEHLQVVLDPYNFLSRPLLKAQGRAFAELVRWFEPHFVLAHAKDVSPEGAEVDTPEFGRGAFVQEPFVAFLYTRRPDLPVIVEHLPLEHVPEVVARLRALGAQARLEAAGLGARPPAWEV
jgi:sugar phosphate isomerase/epimerase